MRDAASSAAASCNCCGSSGAEIGETEARAEMGEMLSVNIKKLLHTLGLPCCCCCCGCFCCCWPEGGYKLIYQHLTA